MRLSLLDISGNYFFMNQSFSNQYEGKQLVQFMLPLNDCKSINYNIIDVHTLVFNIMRVNSNVFQQERESNKMKVTSTGITYENNGGALTLEVFSKATIYRCYFKANEAAENGGAIY